MKIKGFIIVSPELLHMKEDLEADVFEWWFNTQWCRYQFGNNYMSASNFGKYCIKVELYE